MSVRSESHKKQAPGLEILGAVVLLGALVRLAVAGATFPSTPVGDELYCLATSVRIAQGHGHTTGSPLHLKVAWPLELPAEEAEALRELGYVD